MEYITKNTWETEKLGENLAVKLRGGEIIALIGNLGSGKTVFTKGIAKALGINKRITSPTFVFWRSYKVSHRSRIKYLCHIDLYRLPKPRGILALGIDEYWQRADTICVIEWAEKIKNYLSKKNLFLVKFDLINSNVRKIIINKRY